MVRLLPWETNAFTKPDSISTTDLSNAVKIKRGKETIIFRTDKPEDKKALLLAFKKVAEELTNKRRNEMLLEAEARKGDVRIFIPLPPDAFPALTRVT